MATMIAVMLLLFGTSIAVFYLNRNQVFDQKSSANQLRATIALEMAEAGAEWATGMLNRPYDMHPNCTFDTTTNVSFRRKYVQINYADPAAIAAKTSLDIAVAANVRPGCFITNGALNCTCPAANTGDATLAPTPAAPGFSVSFAPVAGDAHSVEVTSIGCTALDSACTATTAANADATATVKTILKLRPLLRAAPASPLTCGSSCNLSGSFTVENVDSATNGITINSGGAVTGAAGAITSIPGAPSVNSLVSGDESLSTLANADATCSNDRIFNAYFGSSLEQYMASPATKSITCSSASDCGSKVSQAYSDGWRSYYFPIGLQLNNSSNIASLGSRADPVSIVSPSQIKINGNMDIYGLVFSNDADYGDLGTGSSNIHGALVSCKDFASNGNGSVTYDPDALRNLQASSALMVRIPGSWRDF